MQQCKKLQRQPVDVDPRGRGASPTHLPRRDVEDGGQGHKAVAQHHTAEPGTRVVAGSPAITISCTTLSAVSPYRKFG